ncbi:Hypothetical predicted protein [Cloeon dipterum]|uniref:Uncharacterized protein n=1 Tax=Cloeon dipterum TaxID=197152 RepID=A0A8S1DCS9_9INSE|nr:Hypothetical predicted protein [Cloeon dipterum]
MLLLLSPPSLETQLRQLMARRSKACAQYLRNSVRRRPAPPPLHPWTTATLEFAAQHHPSTSAGAHILAA